MKCKYAGIVVISVILIGFHPTSALSQTGEIVNIWAAEHPEDVRRVLRLWLVDPLDPEIGSALTRLLLIETNLVVSRADVPLYLSRADPDVKLPPQLLLMYLEYRGVQLAPKHLLVDQTFMIIGDGK